MPSSPAHRGTEGAEPARPLTHIAIEVSHDAGASSDVRISVIRDSVTTSTLRASAAIRRVLALLRGPA